MQSTVTYRAAASPTKHALITKLCTNMHNCLPSLSGKLLLRKRAIIETIVDQLKYICQIAHTRHRSPFSFLGTLMAGLIAYCHQPKKPALDLDHFALQQVLLIPN